jgi:hypothetical protein
VPSCPKDGWLTINGTVLYKIDCGWLHSHERQNSTLDQGGAVVVRCECNARPQPVGKNNPRLQPGLPDFYQ